MQDLEGTRASIGQPGFDGHHVGFAVLPNRAFDLIFLDVCGSRSRVARPIVEDGVYCTFEFGPPTQRVQIILPDLRDIRSAWVSVDDAERSARAAMNDGTYAAGPPDATLLVETQWTWLQQVLKREADVRLFASSIQFASEGRGWECWANFPSEKRRLMDVIRTTRAQGVVVVSGDAHFAEACRQDDGAPYSIWDVTSSGLTESWPYPGPSRNRVPGQLMTGCNFGVLDFAWQPISQVEYSLCSADGSAGLNGRIPL